MNYKKIAETAMLAGKIMLESNAETYRVEETVEHILKISKLEVTEAFVLTTGITLTLDDSSIEAITLVRRVKNRGVDLANIHKVNHISRQLCAGNISIDQAHAQLSQLSPFNYTSAEFYIANILLAVCFTIMLGGNAFDSLVTFINTVVMIIIWSIAKHLKMSLFIKNVISCFVMAAIGSTFTHLFTSELSLNAILVGSIMPMVPGTIITNAIRDTFHGDYTSGVARSIEAILIGFSIAIGVTLGVILTNGGKFIV